jgi:hypothetical protein
MFVASIAAAVSAAAAAITAGTQQQIKKAPGVPGLSRKHPSLGIKVP